MVYGAETDCLLHMMGGPLVSESNEQLEDGSAYRQLRPTKLDEIKNFHAEVQVGALAQTYQRPARSTPFHGPR